MSKTKKRLPFWQKLQAGTIANTAMTRGKINSINAFRSYVHSARFKSIHPFIEAFFAMFGKMTEPDAVALLKDMGYGELDQGCFAARLDECRGDRGKGSMRTYGSRVSFSSGRVGQVWGFVPVANKVERAQAYLEHWQDRLKRYREQRDKIDKDIQRIGDRTAAAADTLLAVSAAANVKRTPSTFPQVTCTSYAR